MRSISGQRQSKGRDIVNGLKLSLILTGNEYGIPRGKDVLHDRSHRLDRLWLVIDRRSESFAGEITAKLLSDGRSHEPVAELSGQFFDDTQIR